MEKGQLSRKLAVILHADVVGSTSLVQKNETLAHERIQSVFHQFSKTIKSYGGITRELRGDALVAEFERASDAVPAALAFQVSNEDFNSRLEDDIQPQLRIGISLGEVIIADNTITGAGVVLAQRLEQLAEPGGAVVQGSVSETIPARMPFEFNSLGEQVLKGFDQPVRAFTVKLQSGEELPQPEVSTTPQKADSTILEISDKFSIAVLPFTNMSNDSEQEYFSDGITEDIITELSRFRSLFVIARNSSFAFKGQSIDVTEIGKKLGVQFVVEGSVRKAGERIRITAQLIEASTGNHLWAERYDRNLSDIFEVQDEVASQIVTMVPGHMDISNRVQAERKPAQDMTAYDLVLRAEHEIRWDFGSGEGERLLKQALEIDPAYARTHARLALFYAYAIFVHGQGVNKCVESARLHAESALKLDSSDPLIHVSLAGTYIMVGEHALAGYHVDKAIALNPNAYEVMVLAAEIKAYLGDYKTAVFWANKALLSDPYSADAFREAYFDAHYIGEEYELALEQMIGWQDPGPYNYLSAAAAFAQLDRMDEARDAIRQFEKICPEGWDSEEVIRAHARMCAKSEDGARWIEGFRKAGVKI
jgi:adenylate cyclase